MLEILFRIARNVRVPVTADIEAGYADTVEALKENILRVMETGVVGINLEDSLIEGGPLRSIAEQWERIATVREAASRHGLHLVINARVDSFLSVGFNSREEKIEEAVVDAKAYVVAGANCIYPIRPGDRETVSQLLERIPSPINVVALLKALALAVNYCGFC